MRSTEETHNKVNNFLGESYRGSTANFGRDFDIHEKILKCYIFIYFSQLKKKRIF